MRVQTEIPHLQAKEGSLRRSQPADILTLDLQSPQLRNKFLLFEPPTLWCFIMAAQHGGLRTNEIYIYILLLSKPMQVILYFNCTTDQRVGLPRWFSGKESPCSTGDSRLIPGSERCPGGGNGNLLQCSCLENPTERGAWWATVHGITKSRTQLKRLRTHRQKSSRPICSFFFLIGCAGA